MIKITVRFRLVLLTLSLLWIMCAYPVKVLANDLSGHPVPQQDYNENSWRYCDGNLIIANDVGDESGIASFALGGMIFEDASSLGIDVSAHQGSIDWDTVKKYVDFVIIRCGFGSDYLDQDDVYWQRNVAACERLGIPYGVYLYSYADSTLKAESEAYHALRLLEGHTPTLPVFYDLEDDKISNNCTKTQILEQTKIFCQTVQQAGYEVGVYANKYWWTTFLIDSTYDNWERWVAQYSSSCTYMGEFNYWQYSSSGTIPGISGAVDMNYSRLLIGNGEHLEQKPDLPDEPYAKPFLELSNGAYIKACVQSDKGQTIPYTSSEMTTRGSITHGANFGAYIDNAEDELYLYSVGKNEKGQYWVYCSYPSGNSRSFAYIHYEDISDVIYNSDGMIISSQSDCTLYKRHSAESKNETYYVATGDKVFLIGRDSEENRYLISYPVLNGNWRMAWCDNDDLEAIGLYECNHIWNDGEVINKLQCFGTGEIKYTCNECGTSYTETIESDRHIGPEIIKFKKNPSCLVDGYTGDAYCRTCNELIVEGEAVPATGHQRMELRNQKAATLDYPGYTGDEYCLDCETCVKTGEIIPCLKRIEFTVQNGCIKVKLLGNKPIQNMGLIYGCDDNLQLNTPGRTRIAFTELSSDGTFTFDATGLFGYTFKAYVIYEDEEGNEVIVYSDPITF